MSPQENYWFWEIRRDILESMPIKQITPSDFAEWLLLKEKMAEYELKHFGN